MFSFRHDRDNYREFAQHIFATLTNLVLIMPNSGCK